MVVHESVGGRAIDAVEFEFEGKGRAGHESFQFGDAHALDVHVIHVLPDHFGDRFDGIVGETKAAQDGFGHFRAHAVVAVEADAAVIIDRAGGGFGDVVEQDGPDEILRSVGREQAEHDPRVGPDIAFGMELGRLIASPQGEHLREDHAEQSRVGEQVKSGNPARMAEDAGKFRAHAFGGDAGDGWCMALERVEGGGFDGKAVEFGGETDRAQQTKVILVEALIGIPDGAQEAVFQVGAATDMVDDFPGFRILEETVDGEVAPPGILFGGGKDDTLGAAPVPVLPVAAEGGDFVFDSPAGHDNHTEMGADHAGPGEEGGHLLGAGVGRDVVVLRCPPEQPVAHAAAGEPCGEPGPAQAPGQLHGLGTSGIHIQPCPTGKPLASRAIRPMVGARMSNPVVILGTASAFFLGACVGSFLNVCIYRWPLGLKVNEPARSFCPGCRRQIPMLQNIPLLSWLLLRGRCAGCQSPIAFRYFAVELLTALVFLGLWMVFPPGQAIALALLAVACIVTVFVDFEHYIIPNQVTWGVLPFGLLASALVMELHGQPTWWQGLLQGVLGAALGYAILWAIVELGKRAFGRQKREFASPVPWELRDGPADAPELALAGETLAWEDIFSRQSDRLVIETSGVLVDGRKKESADRVTVAWDHVEITSGEGKPRRFELSALKSLGGETTKVVVPREAMGMGDVFFLCMAGAFVGWKGVLFTVFCASVYGSLFGALVWALGRRHWAGRIPFGPWLVAALWTWILAGHTLFLWYLDWLGIEPDGPLFRSF